MKRIYYISILLVFVAFCGCNDERTNTSKKFNIEIAFEKSHGKATSTYKEMIVFYDADYRLSK